MNTAVAQVSISSDNMEVDGKSGGVAGCVGEQDVVMGIPIAGGDPDSVFDIPLSDSTPMTNGTLVTNEHAAPQAFAPIQEGDSYADNEC